MGSLEGKVAIVTGAGRGIGRATALLFARKQANVVVVSRNESELRKLAREAAAASGGEIRPVVGDVRDDETAPRAVSEALLAFGRLDVLVNNAGIAVFRPIWESSVADYDDQMDTNMRSTFLFTRAVVGLFIEQGEGAIVNVSSMAGVEGYADLSAYCAAKFAQVGFTRALDRDLRAKNVKVSCVLPGATATEIADGRWGAGSGVPRTKLLAPEDVAKAILFAATQDDPSGILELRLASIGEDR